MGILNMSFRRRRSDCGVLSENSTKWCAKGYFKKALGTEDLAERDFAMIRGVEYHAGETTWNGLDRRRSLSLIWSSTTE